MILYTLIAALILTPVWIEILMGVIRIIEHLLTTYIPLFTFFYPAIFLTYFITSIIICLIFFLHNLIQNQKIKNKLLLNVENFYHRFERPFLISGFVILSQVVMSGGIWLLSWINTTFSTTWDPLLISLYVKVFLFIVLVILSKVNFLKRVKTMFSIIASLIAASFLIYVFVVIVIELSPKVYLSFPLNDTKARYIVNYDGDYWLTYYEVKQNCNGNICTDELIKQGNAPIIEAPVDMKDYNDKIVRVEGSFMGKYGIGGWSGKKEICIKKSFFEKECIPSTGSGTWHSSPLKITSIELDE